MKFQHVACLVPIHWSMFFLVKAMQYISSHYFVPVVSSGLIAGTSFAAQYLRENGITFYKVREEAINLLGTSVDKYYAPDDPPLTEPAQRAIDWAVDEKLKSGRVSSSNRFYDLQIS